MDGLPWPTITASSGGWLLLGVMLYGLITGRWIAARREADSYLDRAKIAEANVEKLVAAVADLTAISHLQKAVIDAGLKRDGTSPEGGERA